MKCPQCDYVCSNLRDICPKCYFDLRPDKKTQGLPISYPQASYEQLVARIAQKSESESTPSPTRVVSKFLSSIFEPKENSPHSRIKRKTTVVGAVDPEPPPQQPSPISIKEYEDKLDKALENVIAHEEAKYLGDTNQAPISAPPSPALSLLSNAPETPPSPEFFPTENTFNLEEEELLFSSSMETHHPESVIPEIPIAEIPLASEPLVEPLLQESEELAPPLPEIIPPLPFEPPPSPSSTFDRKLQELDLFATIPGDTVSHLYWDAARSLNEYQNTELEISATQFIRRTFDEKIKLLYLLAEESLINPEALEKLQDDFIVSTDRKLDATTLEEKLQAITKLAETSQFNLREGSKLKVARYGDKDGQEGAEVLALPTKVPQHLIRKAYLWDAAAIAIISLIGTLITLKLTHDSAYPMIRTLDFGAYPAIELLFPLCLWIGITILTNFVYHLLFALIGSETIGYQRVSTTLVDFEGERATIGLRLSRLFYAPFCLLSISRWWWGQKEEQACKGYTLIDLLSATVITERSTTEEFTPP